MKNDDEDEPIVMDPKAFADFVEEYVRSKRNDITEEGEIVVKIKKDDLKGLANALITTSHELKDEKQRMHILHRIVGVLCRKELGHKLRVDIAAMDNLNPQGKLTMQGIKNRRTGEPVVLEVAWTEPMIRPVLEIPGR